MDTILAMLDTILSSVNFVQGQNIHFYMKTLITMLFCIVLNSFILILQPLPDAAVIPVL